MYEIIIITVTIIIIIIIIIIITIIITFIYLTSKIYNSAVNQKNVNRIRRKRILV